VGIGSLCEARPSFTRCRFVNACISNMKRPGFIPRPIFPERLCLYPWGFRRFLVKGLPGKILIQSLPPALDEARDGHAGSFNLAVGNPAFSMALSP